jgi:hypothetical protein
MSSYIKLKLTEEVGPSAVIGRTVRLPWQTVRRGSVDRLCGSWGGGASLDVLDVISDRPRLGSGPSAGVSRTVRACRAQVGPRPRDEVKQAPLLLSPTRPNLLPFLFLAPSQRKGLPLRDFDWGTPRTVRSHPRTLREVLHHVIQVFFRISHSISQILSNEVVRVWKRDLKFVHDFKILAW